MERFFIILLIRRYSFIFDQICPDFSEKLVRIVEVKKYSKFATTNILRLEKS